MTTKKINWKKEKTQLKFNWSKKKDKARKRNNCGDCFSPPLYTLFPERAVCGDMQSIKDCMTLQFSSKEFEFQIDMNRNKWRRKSMPYFLICIYHMYCCKFKALMVSQSRPVMAPQFRTFQNGNNIVKDLPDEFIY